MRLLVAHVDKRTMSCTVDGRVVESGAGHELRLEAKKYCACIGARARVTDAYACVRAEQL